MLATLVEIFGQKARQWYRSHRDNQAEFNRAVEAAKESIRADYPDHYKLHADPRKMTVADAEREFALHSHAEAKVHNMLIGGKSLGQYSLHLQE